MVTNKTFGNRGIFSEGKHNIVTKIHSNMTKTSIRLSINKHFPKATNHTQGLFKDFQRSPSFSRTFKAFNLHHLNSSTFKHSQGPAGTRVIFQKSSDTDFVKYKLHNWCHVKIYKNYHVRVRCRSSSINFNAQ